MTPEQRRDLAAHYHTELMDRVLPFWEQHSPDLQFGGYYTCLNRQGVVYDTDKFVWLQARQVWMFSKLYRTVEPRTDWLEMARLGAEFLREHGRDHNGDWYFALTRDGTPLVQPYNMFSDCFAAMAFAAYGRAADQQWAMDLAVQTFERIQTRWDNPKGQYNKLVPETRPLLALAPPMIAVNLALEIADCLPDYDLETVIARSLKTIVSLFIDRSRGVIHEFVAPDGSHPDCFDGRLINPGHGIECCWFLMDAAVKRGDDALLSLAADALLDQLEFGWDSDCGGIFNFMDVHGHPPQQLEHDQKLWWVHLEALIGTLMGLHATGRPAFAEWYQRIHDYTWSHFPDPDYGEWYGYLNREGKVLLPLKGGKWKGCFHLPRALLQCQRILEGPQPTVR